MLPDEVKNVLSLSFPRCSVCDTAWYDYKEKEEDEEDTKMPAKTAATESRKRKRTTIRQRPSHYTLYPMPKCQCSTRLALPHNMNLPLLPSSSKDTSNNEEEDEPTSIFSKISTHTFSNLAMCKCCIQKLLHTSNEIVIHDYRQSHIENGQPDVKFTVDTKCTICSQKFLPRQLMRLLANDEQQQQHGSAKKSSGTTTKKKSNSNINWYDAVEATIQLVGWGKKHQRRERIKMQRDIKRAKMTRNVNDNDDDGKRDTWWSNHDGFTGGGGNYSSDDCYSYSSDNNDSDDDDDINYSHKRTSNVHRISTKKGELLNELLSKDPKLKQELDDKPYAKELAKKLKDEEEKQRIAAEAQAKKDHELALKMQQEIDEQEEKRKKIEKKEPAKTRGARRKSTPINNPIFNAWSASAKKKKEMKKSPPKQRQLDECLLPQNSSTKKQQSNCGRSTEVQDKQTVPQSTTAASTSNNHREDGIRTIVSMGFNEGAAQQCLNDADGNVQRAITILLSGASGSNK